MKFKVDLQFVKSTKGTHVFANEAEKMSIYFQKDKFSGEAPKRITATFEYVAE